METPCVQVCVMDPASGLCIGCGRNTAEIGSWMALPPGQRREIMAALPQRMSSIVARDARCNVRRQART